MKGEEMARKDITQCPEGIAELTDIREDIRNIFHILRELKDDMASVARNIAVHDVQLLHMKEGFEKHLAFSEATASRLTKLEEIKFQTKGFVQGMTKGTGLLICGGTGAFTAALMYILQLWNGKNGLH